MLRSDRPLSQTRDYETTVTPQRRCNDSSSASILINRSRIPCDRLRSKRRYGECCNLHIARLHSKGNCAPVAGEVRISTSDVVGAGTKAERDGRLLVANYRFDRHDSLTSALRHHFEYTWISGPDHKSSVRCKRTNCKRQNQGKHRYSGHQHTVSQPADSASGCGGFR